MTWFMVVDKPIGLTSHDVVGIFRAVTGEPKVGHTGTLDPFATGVLALAFGQATRLIQHLDESLKVYDATIALGAATDTGDPTGEVIESKPIPALDREHVLAVLQSFLGDRMQRPPAYSAVKVKGRALYSYARAGETVEVAARPIKIHSIDLVELSETHMRVTIHCSRGTYARVIAEEVAVALGTVGHLSALSRLQSGPFKLEDAVTLDKLAELVGGEGMTWQQVFRGEGRTREDRAAWRPRDAVRAGLRPWLRAPLAALPHLPLIDVDEAGAARVRHGHVPSRLPPGRVSGAYLIACGADVLGVAEATPRGPRMLAVLGGPPPRAVDAPAADESGSDPGAGSPPASADAS